MQCGQDNRYCGRTVLVYVIKIVLIFMYTDYILIFNFIMHQPFEAQFLLTVQCNIMSKTQHSTPSEFVSFMSFS